MMLAKGRNVSVPASVRVDQSSEDCATCVTESNCLRVIPAGISPTPNNATGPRIRATQFGFSRSIASSRRGISNSSSNLSPSFHARCNARNLPGAISFSTLRPFIDILVFGPIQAGIRRYRAKVSGRDNAKSNWLVFALGYCVFWVSITLVLFCCHETREGRNRLT
jgi:hypothetical protein